MRDGQGGVTLVEVVVVLARAGHPDRRGRSQGRRGPRGVPGDRGDRGPLRRRTSDEGARPAHGVMHALVLEPDGGGFRIVADPGGDAQTVEGPHRLVDGAVATSNVTIQFSPKGFAVPAGTITIRSGGETRRIVVSLLGRARVAAGEDPPGGGNHGHDGHTART